MKVRALLLVAAIAGGLTVTSCSSDTTWTVTYYDGDTAIHTETVVDGETAPEWDPTDTVTDKQFHGWYIEPTLAHEWDFTTAITSDTSIYGMFTTYEEDTREWVIAGSGSSSILTSSNWGTVVNDEHILTHEDSDTENVYTITLDLFAGDQFQFMVPEYDEETGSISWGAQRGGGYLDTLTDDEGTQYFTVGGGIDSSTKKSNITASISGNYTFYLHTYPNLDYYTDDETDNPNANVSDYDEITWTYNGPTTEVLPDTITYFYIKGNDVTNWLDVYTDRTTMVTENYDTYTLSIYLYEDDVFMFASRVYNTGTGEYSSGNAYIRGSNVVSGSDYVSGEGNMTALASGLYTFTYVASTEELTVEFDGEADPTWLSYEYYLNGSYDNDPSWANKVGNPDYQFTIDEDGGRYYSLENITLEVGDQLGVQVTDEGAASYITYWNASYVVTYEDSSLTSDDPPVDASDCFDLTSTNLVCSTAGTYDFTLDAYRENIIVTVHAEA